jgi:tetratricopeptide (TPR) repeat protein
MGQPQHAIRELRTITRDYPQYVPARIQLGKCYYDSHQIPEAIEQWESALALEPKNQTLQDYLRLAQTVQVTQLNRPHMEL